MPESENAIQKGKIVCKCCIKSNNENDSFISSKKKLIINMNNVIGVHSNTPNRVFKVTNV